MKIEKLSPAFKDYLWGGTKLRDVYGKKCDYEKVAESWELSTHPAGQSVINGGEYDGLKFGEYLEKVGAKALGKCLCLTHGEAAGYDSFCKFKLLFGVFYGQKCSCVTG